MESHVQQSSKDLPSDHYIIPEEEETAKSPSSTQNKLWTFLKSVEQLLGALQVLIGLINTSLWTKWILWLSQEDQGRGHFEIFTSGYAFWGGLSFTISGVFSLVSSEIPSKALVKCCLVTSFLSALAALTGIIIIHLNMIVNHECQGGHQNFTCYENIVTVTGLILELFMLATMEFCISTFLIALSAFRIKVLAKKSRESLENLYEDLLFKSAPYDEIRPAQYGHEQYDS